MPPNTPHRSARSRFVALLPLVLAGACGGGGGSTGVVVQDPPVEPQPTASLSLSEPASDTDVAPLASMRVVLQARDPLARATLRLLLDTDGDAGTRTDQILLASLPPEQLGDLTLDVPLPATAVSGTHHLLGLLDDGVRAAVAAFAPGRITIATGGPVDPPDEEPDPLALALSAPATDAQIARGGTVAVRFVVPGTGTAQLRILADSDGNAATTGDQHELTSRTIARGATATDAVVPADVPVGAYAVLGIATTPDGAVARATAPGRLEVVDVGLAVREGNTSYEEGRALAFAADGALLAAGRFSGSTTFGLWPQVTHLNAQGDDDVFLARYRTDGTLAWARRAGGPSRADWPAAIAADPDGTFVVGGFFHGLAAFDGGAPTSGLQSAGDDDGFLARYAADGALLWARRFGGLLRDEIAGLVRAADGSLLVTGSFAAQAQFGTVSLTVRGALSTSDGFVARYDAAGTPLWVRQFGGADVDDAGRAIAATADGGVLVAGNFRGTATFGDGAAAVALTATGGSDVFVARYDGNGSLLWIRRGGGTLDDEARSLAVTSAGDAVVGGGFRAQAGFADAAQPLALLALGGLDGFLARYASDGALQSVQTVGSTGDDEVRSVAATADGGIVATGHFQTSALVTGVTPAVSLVGFGGRDAFVARYDANGVLAWVRAAGGAEHDQALAVAVAGNGAFAITGSFLTAAGFGSGANRQTLTAVGWADAFVVRYNADGDL
ncbi:MAG: hypothetical protein JNL08_12180 [Planctomycetes bacterium]|nr:hypothetical protein [Planctomycetota bacterium]